MNYLTKNPLCLGIDPGIGNTGWAAVRRTATGYRLRDSGVICTVPHAPLGYCLNHHYEAVRELLTEHSPPCVYRERFFQSQHLIMHLNGFSDSNCGTGE